MDKSAAKTKERFRKDQERVAPKPDINREAKSDKETVNMDSGSLIHPSFPDMGEMRPAFEGSQSDVPDK